jgi:hypothetical protein
VITPRLYCPYCKGLVKPLTRSLRADLVGTQRCCIACGHIWRLNREYFAVIVMSLCVLAVGVAGAFYIFYPPKDADIYTLLWLSACVMLVWPVVYYVTWRLKLRR